MTDNFTQINYNKKWGTHVRVEIKSLYHVRVEIKKYKQKPARLSSNGLFCVSTTKSLKPPCFYRAEQQNDYYKSNTE